MDRRHLLSLMAGGIGVAVAIGIQLHGGRNMAIDYRKLKLAELP